MKFILMLFLTSFVLFQKVNSDDTLFSEQFNDTILLNLNKLDNEGKVNYLLDLAWASRFEQPKFALKCLDSVEILCNTLNVKFLLPTTINYKGVVFLHLNELSKALEYFFQALKEAEYQKNLEQIGYSFNNIGYVFKNRGDFDKGYYYVNKSIEYQKKANSIRGLAYSYSRMSELFGLKKNYDSAYFYAFQSLKLREELQDEKAIKSSIYALGEVLEDKGNYREALTKFYAVKDQVSRIHRTYQKMANCYHKLNFLDSALYFAKLSEEKALNINDHLISYEISLLLSKIYESQGDFKSSYNSLKNALAFKDSIDIEQKNKDITSAEIAYQTNQKDQLNQKLINQATRAKIILISSTLLIILLVILAITLFRNRTKERKQNILLKDQNDRIEKQSEKLHELNAMKDKFFSIIAHDLKNPIGSLKELTEVLFENHTYFDKKDLEEYLFLVKSTTSQVFNLLINLLDWSRSQRGQISFQPIELNAELYLNSLLSNLKPMANKKEIKLLPEVKTNFSFTADSNMISTVIRNLVTNSIKFTKNQGEIIVSAQENLQDYQFIIQDSGIGMSKDQSEKLFKIDSNFSTPGTANESGTGLGLILCKEFIDKHNGKIWVESVVGVGSKFIFTINKEFQPFNY